MVLEITCNMHGLHYLSNKVILSTSMRRASEPQALVPDSLLLLSSDRAVPDYICFYVSEASLSSISHCARCHTDSNNRISSFNTLLEQELTDSGPQCRPR